MSLRASNAAGLKQRTTPVAELSDLAATILEALKIGGEFFAGEIADTYEVSIDAVFKALDELERAGLATITHASLNV